MLAAVVGRPGGGGFQAVVGAQVDQHGAGRGCLQRGGDLTGRAVRQRQADHVVAGERLDRGLADHPVRQRQQVRVVDAEPVAG